MDRQLKQCQAKFSRWRSQISPSEKKRTPVGLRAEATALLEHFSMAQLAKALGVPLTTLKYWRYAAKSEGAPVSKHTDPIVDFVPLPPLKDLMLPEPGAPFDCSVRLTQGVSISLTTPSAEAMALLIRSLLKEAAPCSI